MHLVFNGLNEAFEHILRLFDNSRKVKTTHSRNGDVRKFTEPFLLTYLYPRKRVMLWKGRNANPFFHVYEAMWMLAGRNDLESLKTFVSDFGRFSDDGVTLNGAYGYRWRVADLQEEDLEEFSEETLVSIGHTFAQRIGHDDTKMDQLVLLLDLLHQSKDTRRAVLTMWNVKDDLLKTLYSKDVCCNLNVMFSISWDKCSSCKGLKDYCPNCEHRPKNYTREIPTSLDMTVTNRSNDMVLGMLGANFVHFTFLQEYMAMLLGLEVGKYHHFTNDLHIYTGGSTKSTSEYLKHSPRLSYNVDNIKQSRVIDYERIVTLAHPHNPDSMDDILTHQKHLDEDIVHFADHPYSMQKYRYSPFLEKVAKPMMQVHKEWTKTKNKARVLELALDIEDLAWYDAVIDWLENRF